MLSTCDFMQDCILINTKNPYMIPPCIRHYLGIICVSDKKIRENLIKAVVKGPHLVHSIIGVHRTPCITLSIFLSL